MKIAFRQRGQGSKYTLFIATRSHSTILISTPRATTWTYAHNPVLCKSLTCVCNNYFSSPVSDSVYSLLSRGVYYSPIELPLETVYSPRPCRPEFSSFRYRAPSNPNQLSLNRFSSSVSSRSRSWIVVHADTITPIMVAYHSHVTETILRIAKEFFISATIISEGFENLFPRIGKKLGNNRIDSIL